MQAQRPLYETLKTSSELGWSTLLAELRSYHRGESTAPVAPLARIAIVVGGSGKGSANLKIEGKWWSALLMPGHIWLKPTGGKCDEGYTSSTAQVLDISLSAAVFAQLRNDYKLPAAPDHSIRYQGGVKDEVINQIGLSVLSEMMNPTAAGRMLVETSSLMLAARLVHAHFDAGLARPTIESRHRLDDQRLRRVVDYVEDHLGDDIAVAISPKSRALASFTSHARSRPQQACHRIATSVRGAWSGLK